MKIHIDLTPQTAASLATDLVTHGELGAKLEAATRMLSRVLESEEDRTDRVLEHLERFRDAEAFGWEIGPAESPEGEALVCALEGEIDCELDLLLATRSDARKLGDALLDLLALLQSLELTEVRVKKSGRRSSLEELGDEIVRLAGEHSVFLIPADERVVADLDGDDDVDDDEDDLDDDEDADDLEEEDPDDVEGTGHRADGGRAEPRRRVNRGAGSATDAPDEDGFPPGGWGHRGPAPAPRTRHFSADETFFLEVTGLEWPSDIDSVRAALRGVAPRYAPDPAFRNPALYAARQAQMTRLNCGHDGLLARLRQDPR